MQRREFVKLLSASGVIALCAGPEELLSSTNMRFGPDYFKKIRLFDATSQDDVFVGPEQMHLFESVTARLYRAQRIVGHANFALLDIDLAVRYARNYSKIGRFSKEEVALLDDLFHRNAADYGFFGPKVLERFTSRIKKKETVKIPRSGQYLFRGKPERLYRQIQDDLGESIVLTSGIRGIVKQLYLFLNKAAQNGGNLSLASRSLAPSGYSFHGIGDFDVGKKGFGVRNFMSDFSSTDEYRRLRDLGYVSIRYHENNLQGVRFEPWHIKVV